MINAMKLNDVVNRVRVESLDSESGGGGGSSGDMDKLIDRTITEVNSNAESIGSYAFAFCENLSSINLPECTVINNYAFIRCSNLQTIAMNKFSGTLSFGSGTTLSALRAASIPHCTSLAGSAFYNCSQLTDVDIRDCEYIDMGAFQRCSSLEKLYLPKCSYINMAFEGCTSLSELYMLSTAVATFSVPNAYANPFASTKLSSTGTGSIYVRASLVDAYKSASVWENVGDRIVGLTDEEIEALDF